MENEQDKKKFSNKLVWIIVAAIAIGVFFFIMLIKKVPEGTIVHIGPVQIGNKHSGPTYRDGRKMVYIRGLQNALELYWQEFERYPCGNGWDILRDEVMKLGVFDEFPSDGHGISTSPPYDYASSDSCESYVLKAEFESEDSLTLENDEDGVIYGINCDDPGYCVRF